MRKILCVTDDIASTDSQAGPHGGSKKQKSRQMLDVVLCTQQHDHNQSTNECIWRWLEIGAQRATLLYFCRHAHSSTFFFRNPSSHDKEKEHTGLACAWYHTGLLYVQPCVHTDDTRWYMTAAVVLGAC